MFQAFLKVSESLRHFGGECEINCRPPLLRCPTVPCTLFDRCHSENGQFRAGLSPFLAEINLRTGGSGAKTLPWFVSIGTQFTPHSKNTPESNNELQSETKEML